VDKLYKKLNICISYHEQKRSYVELKSRITSTLAGVSGYPDLSTIKSEKWQIPFTVLEHTSTLSNFHSEAIQEKLECGPMPNMMVALPNIGGALCSMPQSLADAHS